MRQDPDVIMVGEMRDPETVSTVITAAETGHLVFSTLHTNSAAADGRPHPRHLPARPAGADPRPARADPQGRRVDEAGRAARTARAGSRRWRSCAPRPKIAKMIEDGEISQIHEEIESSVGYYRMQSMNQSLLALLVHGTITYAEAMAPVVRSRRPLPQAPQDVPQIEEQGRRIEPSSRPISRRSPSSSSSSGCTRSRKRRSSSSSPRRTSRSASLQHAIRQRDQQIEELEGRDCRSCRPGARAPARRLRPAAPGGPGEDRQAEGAHQGAQPAADGRRETAGRRRREVGSSGRRPKGLQGGRDGVVPAS